MENAKIALINAKTVVDEKLKAGFTMQDIPDLACMIHDIKEIGKYLESHGYEPDYESDEMDEITWILRTISDELKGAEKYYKKWEESKDDSYKAIGREELRHAETLIKTAKPKIATQENNAKLHDMILQYQNLLAKLS